MCFCEMNQIYSSYPRVVFTWFPQELCEFCQGFAHWDASEVNGVIVRTESEWMLLLLGLNGEASECMMEAVKEFLERVWYVRSRELNHV